MEWTVNCLLCNLPAAVKKTKTNKLMLRCDNCKLLVFANGVDSQMKLGSLPEYSSHYVSSPYGH